MCFLGVLTMTHNNFKRFKLPPQKKNKGAWLDFPAKLAKSWNRNIFDGEDRIETIDRVTEPPSWLRGWSWMTKFKFKMADGRRIAKCWKCYNSPICRPIWTKLGWLHPIMSTTCLPWRGCHGNYCCLATMHWKFSSYWRLEAERMNQFWRNSVVVVVFIGRIVISEQREQEKKNTAVKLQKYSKHVQSHKITITKRNSN